MKLRKTYSIALFAVTALAAQDQSFSLNPPYGIASQIYSPNNAWSLYGSDHAPQLWIENLATHLKRKVLDVTLQTMSLGWSSDSASFFLNDRDASDRERAYIYEAATLDRLDLKNLITAADRESLRYFPGPRYSSHTYLHILRWVDAKHVDVRLHGHTDEYPVQCFEFRYRVRIDGTVQKLSQHVVPISGAGCGVTQ